MPVIPVRVLSPSNRARYCTVPPVYENQTEKANYTIRCLAPPRRKRNSELMTSFESARWRHATGCVDVCAHANARAKR